MSKIYGDPAIIAAAKKLPVGSPSSLINWEAINDLPDFFEGHVVAVKYTREDFEAVGGGNYMPSSDLVNRICEARGIFGCDGGSVEPFYLEVDWNRLCCKFNEPPYMVKMPVGYISKKQGKVMMEDGVMRTSDECVVLYNAWERLCADAWGKEEAATNFYDPSCMKSYPNGTKYYEYTWYDKAEGKEKTEKKNIKYDTRGKRQLSLDEELKFAQRKADTKARNVVIRVITGMNTGYKESELKSGVFYFHRIQRSEFAIKAEQAAYLQRITDPHRALIENPAEEIYDMTRNVTPEPKAVQPQSNEAVPPEPEPEEVQQQETTRSKPQFLLDILRNYKENGLVPDVMKSGVDSVIDWLEKEPNPEISKYWNKALTVLSTVEASMPEDKRIEHEALV